MDFFTRFPYRWNLSSNCGSWNRIERRACKKTFKFYLSRSLTVLFLIDLRQGGGRAGCPTVWPSGVEECIQL
jgi:hypothetical protein